MAVKTLIGFGFLFACCLLEVSSRPNNEFNPEWIYSGRSKRNGSGADIYRYDGEQFTEGVLTDTKYVLRLNPVAYAVVGTRGLAVANPESHAVIQRNKIGTIVHMPKAIAVVGPGGIAHAQSDLYLYDYDTNKKDDDGLSEV